MPGPSNKKKAKPKAANAGKKQPLKPSTIPSNASDVLDPQQHAPLSDDGQPGHTVSDVSPKYDVPFIENKWNGPRAMDIPSFISSQYAAPPSMEDPVCAGFVLPQIRNMFFLLLPPDNALILWYNKSRKSARICPACRRFYSTGDLLMPHVIDDQSRSAYVDPRNLREKEISGICSLMCFGIASYNWPGSIGAWGKWTSEIDAQTVAILQGPGASMADEGMGAFMKLARQEELPMLVRRGFQM